MVLLQLEYSQEQAEGELKAQQVVPLLPQMVKALHPLVELG